MFRKCQSVMEYVAIFAVIITGLVSVQFLPKVKQAFNSHLQDCAKIILEKQ